MKSVHRIGLVTAGKITGMWIEKTLELKRAVGPVYSTSLRLASRASNTLLRAGFHTTDWEEMRRCETVVLFLPPKSFRTMMQEWIDGGFDLSGLRFVSCDADLGWEDLSELRDQGALTAVLGPLPYYDPQRFVAEGDAAALAPVIRLLEADGPKVNRLKAGGKYQVDEVLDYLHTAALPLFARTVESLRESGLSQEIAVGLTEKSFTQMLRLYARNGRRVLDSKDSRPAEDPASDRGEQSVDPRDLLALEGALMRERTEQDAGVRAVAAAGEGNPPGHR